MTRGNFNTEDFAMARPEFHNDLELDQTHQIEFGIAQPLRRGEATEVDTTTIEKSYHILDDDNNEVDGTLDEKCAAIVGVLKDRYSVDARYSVSGNQTRFAPNNPK